MGTTLPAGRLCKVGRILADAPAEQAAELTRRINGAEWTDRRLAQSLELAGCRVHPSLLSTHRNGVCICQPVETRAAA